MNILVATMKPVLFSFINSVSVKKLVVDLLEAYAKSTDNSLDDTAVKVVKESLLKA